MPKSPVSITVQWLCLAAAVSVLHAQGVPSRSKTQSPPVVIVVNQCNEDLVVLIDGVVVQGQVSGTPLLATSGGGHLKLTEQMIVMTAKMQPVIISVGYVSEFPRKKTVFQARNGVTVVPSAYHTAYVPIDLASLRNPDGTYQVFTWTLNSKDIRTKSPDIAKLIKASTTALPHDNLPLEVDNKSQYPLMVTINNQYSFVLAPTAKQTFTPEKCALFGNQIAMMVLHKAPEGPQGALRVFEAPPDGDWGKEKFSSWQLTDTDFRPSGDLKNVAPEDFTATPISSPAAP